MLNGIAKAMLTSTAIAPVLLTYAWVGFQNGDYGMAVILLIGCFALTFSVVDASDSASTTGTQKILKTMESLIVQKGHLL